MNDPIVVKIPIVLEIEIETRTSRPDVVKAVTKISPPKASSLDKFVCGCGKGFLQEGWYTRHKKKCKEASASSSTPEITPPDYDLPEGGRCKQCGKPIRNILVFCSNECKKDFKEEHREPHKKWGKRSSSDVWKSSKYSAAHVNESWKKKLEADDDYMKKAWGEDKPQPIDGDDVE